MVSVVLIACMSVMADPPIEGDRQLLAAMRDAQLANRTRYPHGEMQVRIVAGRSPEMLQERIEGRFRWNEQDWRFVGTMTNLLEAAKPNYDPVTRIEAIIHDQQYIAYFPRSRIITINDIMKVSPHGSLRLRPEERWYRSGVRWWAELMGPNPAFPQDRVKAYRVGWMNGGDGEIELIRDDKNGSGFRMVSSTRDDGNLVEYRSWNPEAVKPNVVSKKLTHFRWDRDQAGRCYLSETESMTECGRDGEGMRSYSKLTILEFHPDVVPPPKEFRFESLSLEPGTRVEDKVGNRSYRVGSVPVKSVVDQLDELVSDLKSRGFARPEPGR